MAGVEQGGVSTQVTFKSKDQKMHEIIPSLFVGSVFAAEDLALLNSHSITHILQVAEEFEPKHKKHFTYKVYHSTKSITLTSINIVSRSLQLLTNLTT